MSSIVRTAEYNRIYIIVYIFLIPVLLCSKLLREGGHSALGKTVLGGWGWGQPALLHQPCYSILWKCILFSEPVMGKLCSNEIQFPARFLKRDNPAAPPGKTEISLNDNVAYERCNHGKEQADDHQYEKLDEYQA